MAKNCTLDEMFKDLLITSDGISIQTSVPLVLSSYQSNSMVILETYEAQT